MEQHFEHATRLHTPSRAYKLSSWCHENLARGDYDIKYGTVIDGLWARPCLVYSFKYQADLLVFKLVHSI